MDRLGREERLLDLAAHQKTAVLARLVEEHAVATFRRVDDLLLDLVAHAERNRAMQLPSRRAFEEGLVVAVRVYDPAGMLTMASGRSAFRAPVEDREEFRAHQEAVRRSLVIGLPYVAPDTRDVLIPVSRRLEGPQGEFAGVAVADIPVDAFSRFYNVLGLQPGASVALVRTDGAVLARHALNSEVAGRNLAAPEVWQAETARPSGHLRAVSPVDGVERILAYRTALGYPLVAVVGEAVEEVFGPWRQNARLYVALAIATTAVILLFTVGFVVELGWRRRTDRALRVRNRAMAWSGDGILIADATRTGMPIVYANPAFERLMGLPSEILSGQGALNALELAVSDPAALEPLRAAVAVGRDERVEFHSPGTVDTHLELRASPVRDEAGRLVNLIAIVRDISEHKRIQAELAEARREADRANVAKSKFLAAASHDLRQPVQSLMLLMEVLSARATDAMTRNVLGTMDRALGALKMLLDGLLDVSRLEAGVITPEPADFPVNDLLDRIGANSRPVAVQKKLILHIMPCSAHVHSDPMLLGRILQNLVENALRYTDTGRVLVGCRRRGDRLRIEVWDTGIGIPADKQEDIFQEFVQVGNAGRNRDQGLGLGLAVVRRLAQMMGHRVTLRSEPGRGSVFMVEVPLAAAPAAAAVPAAGPAERRATATILVVEDDEIVREGLCAMLEEWGYRVLLAESCAEALDQASRGAGPDAILADYRLRGGRTGTEAIRDVRNLLGRPVPGILVTGDTAPARVQEAEAGDFRVMHKPVAAQELRAALAEVVPAVPVPPLVARDPKRVA
ncbi:hybrid sensor histidine kinase/response regulator [Azospirillum thermophilum]|uniref:histidine kinase n=2 Tax=Azospirillum thermophilum TaxID=2202148 RepID=A0A2S2CTU7_9PROT|nr:hybrid sensor histidine kinase/response regulator [Azospirillum thermophilum]